MVSAFGETSATPWDLDPLKRPEHSLIQRRIVGRTTVRDTVVAVVGLEDASLAQLEPIVEGRLPQNPGEVIFGAGFFRRADVPYETPFILGDNKSMALRCVGSIRDADFRSSQTMIMRLEDAQNFFRRDGFTQVLVSGRGSDSVAVRAQQAHLRAVSPAEALDWVQSAYGPPRGVFSVILLCGIVIAWPAFLITSGFGDERIASEIALLRALGWTKGEIAEKAIMAAFLQSLIAAGLTIIVVYVWLKGFNGVFIAQFFAAEIGLVPQFPIPSVMLASHAGIGLLVALTISLTGNMVVVLRKAWTIPAKELT
jgi:hypothetical protein